jgi:hypothetical protein
VTREGIRLSNGFDAVLYGNIPGDGMSRSASLTINMIRTILEVNHHGEDGVDDFKIIDMDQAVENVHIGSPDVTTRYAYDGDRVIAEYDGSGTLLRKFIYGRRIDEPICLVDKANGGETYYTLFDDLGSVVALCDMVRNGNSHEWRSLLASEAIRVGSRRHISGERRIWHSRGTC